MINNLNINDIKLLNIGFQYEKKIMIIKYKAKFIEDKIFHYRICLSNKINKSYLEIKDYLKKNHQIFYKILDSNKLLDKYIKKFKIKHGIYLNSINNVVNNKQMNFKKKLKNSNIIKLPSNYDDNVSKNINKTNISINKDITNNNSNLINSIEKNKSNLEISKNSKSLRISNKISNNNIGTINDEIYNSISESLEEEESKESSDELIKNFSNNKSITTPNISKKSSLKEISPKKEKDNKKFSVKKSDMFASENFSEFEGEFDESIKENINSVSEVNNSNKDNNSESELESIKFEDSVSENIKISDKIEENKLEKIKEQEKVKEYTEEQKKWIKEGNFNLLDDNEVKKVKDEMNVDFNKNYVKKGDSNYEYDMRKSFVQEESNDWDEESDY